MNKIEYICYFTESEEKYYTDSSIFIIFLSKLKHLKYKLRNS